MKNRGGVWLFGVLLFLGVRCELGWSGFLILSVGVGGFVVYSRVDSGSVLRFRGYLKY
jgi:hypothetical protein